MSNNWDVFSEHLVKEGERRRRQKRLISPKGRQRLQNISRGLGTGTLIYGLQSAVTGDPGKKMLRLPLPFTKKKGIPIPRKFLASLATGVAYGALQPVAKKRRKRRRKYYRRTGRPR